MRTSVFLLFFWLGNAFAEIVSLETVEQWVQSIRHANITRIDGNFEPVYAQEKDQQPIDYRFMPAKANSTVEPQLIYMDEPIQKLVWGKRAYVLPDIYKRWGFPQDSTPWSLGTVALYQVRVGGHSYLCLESNFSGLGMSGNMQFHKAVLVLEAGRALEKLYFSGRYAGCYMVGDYTGNGRLGYIQLKHFDGNEIVQAEVRVLKRRHGQTKAIRAFTFGEKLPVQPLPLDRFGKPPKK